jgi:MYXO-CTERM domain-containing protein
MTFAPTLVQPYAGSFAIQSRPANAAPADPYASFAVNLAGKGTDRAPVLSWRDAGNAVITGLDFGSTAAGTPVERHVFLDNAGPGSAHVNVVNVVGVEGINFEVVPSTCASDQYLAEGASCDLTIRFAPGGAGAKSANAQVVSDGNGPGALALQGTGMGSATPGTLAISTLPAFGTVRVGAQSTPLEVTLSNGGNFPLQVQSVGTVGPFKVQALSCAAPPFVLTPGSSCRVGVTFEPTASGPSQGMLVVATDASATPTQVALSGNAEDAADVSGGGCTVGDGVSPADPTLWVLALLAAGVLWTRRRNRPKP